MVHAILVLLQFAIFKVEKYKAGFYDLPFLIYWKALQNVVCRVYFDGEVFGGEECLRKMRKVIRDYT